MQSILWPGKNDALRETKVLVIRIAGRSTQRGIQACEVQRLSGRYYLWETEKVDSLDSVISLKVRRVGGFENKRM